MTTVEPNIAWAPSSGGGATRLRRGQLVVALITTLLVATCRSQPPPTAQEARGYQPRACGFDLDDDGQVGTARDCAVCDGRTSDPDGDGVDEDLIYVDCGSGEDTPTCGSSAQPCATLQHAWGVIADGPGDGAEDIICFRGTCRHEAPITPGVAGLEATYTRPAGEREARDWVYPRDPTLLAGWDSDGDGAYPPFDDDDTAVLDGAGGAARAFHLDVGSGYLEMAHFTVRNHGHNSDAENSGWIGFGPQPGELSHLHFHDLALEGINKDRGGGSAVSAINLFTGALRLHWLLFENLLVQENGGWFARGAGPDEGPDVGPMRWRHISRTAHSCDFSACGNDAGSTVFKLWGYISGLEVLDSVWDANVGAWEPKPSGGPSGSRFAAVSQCSRDWTIRNNLLLDYKNVLTVQPYAAGYCDGPAARTVDGVHFDRNEVRNRFEPWRYGDVAVDVLGGGEAPGEAVGSVAITSNLFATTTGWEACIWVRAGDGHGTDPGSVMIANNTCHGEINRHAAIVIGDVEGTDAAYPVQRIVLANNLISGLGRDDLNITTTYAPRAWEADHNAYDPDGFFRWQGKRLPNLESWRQASGGDEHALTCRVRLTDVLADDYHLDPADTCARCAGKVLPELVGADLDGDPRPPDGPWDIGADQRLPR